MEQREEEMIYDEGETRKEDSWEPEFELTKEEQRWVALGALKSALMIGMIYIVAAAILIWIMLKIWG